MVMARLEMLKRWQFKPLLCVCVSNCVCTQGVYMCGCVHNACVTGVCRWLLCVCMRVYIVQGWDMETQDHSVCGSGLLCVCVCMCAVFVHGYVLSFLYMSLHVALITGCPGLLSLCPLFLCVSAILVLAAVNLCKHMCVWPPCTCDLCVSSWIVVPGNMCKVRLLPRTKRTN